MRRWTQRRSKYLFLLPCQKAVMQGYSDCSRLTGLIGFRHGALECLMQLHQAGLGHGDVSPRNFGARNGEMIILDFSQSGLCRPVDPSGAHDDCGEVRYLKKYLFGNGKG